MQANVISPQDIENASRALITARRTNLGIEVQMPVVYPTGKSVVVVVTVQGGEYVVHDAGSGAMALTGAGITLTKTLQEKLATLASHYGCDFIGGRMSRRCSPSQIAFAMVMVANASRIVGDQALEARRRPMTVFKTEMTEIVANVYGRERVRNEEAVTSDNGTTYRVDAVILDKEEKSPVAFVEAIADDQSINRHFREFYDLKKTNRYSGVQRVGIYDSRRAWRKGDLSILHDVALTVPYDKASLELTRMTVS